MDELQSIILGALGPSTSADGRLTAEFAKGAGRFISASPYLFQGLLTGLIVFRSAMLGVPEAA